MPATLAITAFLTFILLDGDASIKRSVSIVEKLSLAPPGLFCFFVTAASIAAADFVRAKNGKLETMHETGQEPDLLESRCRDCDQAFWRGFSRVYFAAGAEDDKLCFDVAESAETLIVPLELRDRSGTQTSLNPLAQETT